MQISTPELLDDLRARFALTDTCLEQGKRIFFENAGGALTLKSVVEVSAEYAAIPDNQGRENAASKAGSAVISAAKDDIQRFLNAPNGQVFMGESGTELLFRLIRAACLGVEGGGTVLGSSIEHPASRSAAIRWAKIAGLNYVSVPHDDATGLVTPEAYQAHIRPDTRVAIILHSSPVTGMAMDVEAIAATIRKTAPDCLIIVDGIQYAAHGGLDIEAYGIDGYVISPYKVFSRHGYGLAWISDRLAALPHDSLIGAPDAPWEMGTRDVGAYAAFSEVVRYFEWLGGRVSNAKTSRALIEAAGRAMATQEWALTELMLTGNASQRGLANMPGAIIIGGIKNPARRGLVSVAFSGMDSGELVGALSARGIRSHVRKADHYSGNVLVPLGLESCVRVSLCHYNTADEVLTMLAALEDIL
ncbi:MAG: aminotransferase class V-fold PLP-dependent enzyme [Rhodobacteraceae bacterium]|nr:aminotransferase class V-fold PLP-dependent enzyme [Paracoccaceae bacterium]